MRQWDQECFSFIICTHIDITSPRRFNYFSEKFLSIPNKPKIFIKLFLHTEIVFSISSQQVAWFLNDFKKIRCYKNISELFELTGGRLLAETF